MWNLFSQIRMKASERKKTVTVGASSVLCRFPVDGVDGVDSHHKLVLLGFFHATLA